MEIKLIETQKALSPTQITLADYCINPYRGCEFGCAYCYSKENKNTKDNKFFNQVGVKINIDEILRRQLRYTNPKRVLLGSTTECFQYVEQKYRLSEKILKTLNEFNIPYTILTKSHLIKEYLPLIAENTQNAVYFTLNCARMKCFEHKSPALTQRIDTITAILEKKIDLRIHIGPFVPFISSIEEIFKIIPDDAKQIDIELYHHGMGSFKKILEITEENFGKDLKDKIYSIYKNESAYFEFAQKLRKDIIILKNNHKNISFFYIVPDFDMFYDKRIDYQNELK